MRPRHVVALFCAAIALVFVAFVGASLPQAGEPARLGDTERVTLEQFRIVKLLPDSPPNVRVGDILDTRALTVDQRMHYWVGFVPVGSTVFVPLSRDGKLVTIAVPAGARDPQTQTAEAVAFGLLCLGFAAGLLLLFRGEGAASFAAGLMLLTSGLSVRESLGSWIGPTWLNAALFEVYLWSAPVFAISAFVLGMLLLRDRVSWLFRAVLITLTAVAIAAECFFWSFDYGLWVFTGNTEGGQLVFRYAAIAWMSLTIVTFALAAARSQGPHAAAVRTLFFVTLIGLGERIVFVLSSFGLTPRPPQWLEAACTLVLFAGYCYAFFARRLVALDFVINRAAVFAIIASVIAGILVLVENIIEATALEGKSVFAVQLGATLLVAFSFRWMERRTSEAVERVFFRDKLRAAEALDALPEDFPFHRDRSALANHVVREVVRQLRVPAAVLYFAKGHEYVSGGAAGTDLLSLPPISDTDPGLLRLRSARSPINCGDFQTQLGPAGHAFPLAVLGRVTGCLYVGDRTNGDTLDPDERALLAKLAREAATALLWMAEHKSAAAEEMYRA